MKIEESIGHVWLSQYHMTQFRAFGCLVGEFHSFNNYIAAIIDSVYGNYYKQDNLIYIGQATVKPELSRYNRKMLNNIEDEIGI